VSLHLQGHELHDMFSRYVFVLVRTKTGAGHQKWIIGTARPTTRLETRIRSHRLTGSSKHRLPELYQRAVCTVLQHSFPVKQPEQQDTPPHEAQSAYSNHPPLRFTVSRCVSVSWKRSLDTLAILIIQCKYTALETDKQPRL
jgi:hypothetical protein